MNTYNTLRQWALLIGALGSSTGIGQLNEVLGNSTGQGATQWGIRQLNGAMDSSTGSGQLNGTLGNSMGHWASEWGIGQVNEALGNSVGY